jgi:hypothetical protein
LLALNLLPVPALLRRYVDGGPPLEAGRGGLARWLSFAGWADRFLPRHRVPSTVNT